MKKKKSWDTIIFRQQITIVVILAISLSVLLYTVYNRTENEIRSSNETVLRLKTEEVSMMLKNVWRNTYEIMSYLGERANVNNNSGAMDFIIKADVYQLMQSNINQDESIDTLYIKDNVEGDLILVINSSRPYADRIAIQDYIKNNDSPGHNTTATTCDILEINEQAYYSMAYQSGKYSIGALSSLSHYDGKLLNDVSGTDVGYLMVLGDKIIYQGGYDWSSLITGTGKLKSDVPADAVIASSDFEAADVNIILVSKVDSFSTSIKSADFIVLLCLLTVILILDYFMRRNTIRMVSVPINELTDAYKEISSGNVDYKLTKQFSIKEFDEFEKEFNLVAAEISRLRIEEYEQKLDKQKTDLQVMRAQLRPHFYLNAITTVISMTYQNRDEDIRKYLLSLSKFMRTMLQIDLKMVPLQNEITNINDYLTMQKIRYPGMITSFVSVENKVSETPVPFLILFTAVENVFKHGRGGNEETNIYIQCESYKEEGFSGVRMIVEDTGSGFSEEVIERYKSGKNIREMGDHIGLSNVYRTLQLIYQRSELLRLSNTTPKGARVEILIPEDGGNDENPDR